MLVEGENMEKFKKRTFNSMGEFKMILKIGVMIRNERDF